MSIFYTVYTNINIMIKTFLKKISFRKSVCLFVYFFSVSTKYSSKRNINININVNTVSKYFLY